MSNVYQFFFGTENPHGLGSLCLDALVDVIKGKAEGLFWLEQSFWRVHARRELRTDQEKRLDVLLHNGPNEDKWKDANAAILIENKVYHHLNNDLEHYWDFTTSDELNTQKIGIVLGLRLEKKLPNNWIAITHLEWAQAVERRLGSLVYRAEPRYLTLLLELIENIRTMTNSKENFNELSNFFMRNRPAILRAETLRKQLLQLIPEEVNRLMPIDYKLGYHQEAVKDYWFQIDTAFSQPVHYIVWYGKIFDAAYEQHIPTYVIDLVADEAISTTLRDKLIPVLNDKGIISSNRQRYIAGKEYPLNSTDHHRLPQLIVDSLRNDWQPLEKHWIAEDAE